MHWEARRRQSALERRMAKNQQQVNNMLHQAIKVARLCAEVQLEVILLYVTATVMQLSELFCVTSAAKSDKGPTESTQLHLIPGVITLNTFSPSAHVPQVWPCCINCINCIN